MHPELWRTIAKTIHENYDAYDGFVITHGTDTMAYTASALSFALQGIRKTVVLTGAFVPSFDVATDAINNLVNAVKVACMSLSEICVVFGTSILRGNRAQKKSEVEFEAFHSPKAPPLGRIAVEPELHTERLLVPNRERFLLEADFENAVAVFELVPGMKAEYFEAIIEKGARGVILKAFGPGNVPNKNSPHSLTDAIHAATEKEVPVVVISQCSTGSTRMQMYEVGYDALRAGAIPGHDMTVEAAATKLMWVLARTDSVDKVRAFMNTSLAGEVTIPVGGVQ
jgi:L-asparaginase